MPLCAQNEANFVCVCSCIWQNGKEKLCEFVLLAQSENQQWRACAKKTEKNAKKSDRRVAMPGHTKKK